MTAVIVASGVSPPLANRVGTVGGRQGSAGKRAPKHPTAIDAPGSGHYGGSNIGTTVGSPPPTVSQSPCAASRSFCGSAGSSSRGLAPTELSASWAQWAARAAARAVAAAAALAASAPTAGLPPPGWPGGSVPGGPNNAVTAKGSGYSPGPVSQRLPAAVVEAAAAAATAAAMAARAAASAAQLAEAATHFAAIEEEVGTDNKAREDAEAAAAGAVAAAAAQARAASEALAFVQALVAAVGSSSSVTQGPAQRRKRAGCRRRRPAGSKVVSKSTIGSLVDVRRIEAKRPKKSTKKGNTKKGDSKKGDFKKGDGKKEGKKEGKKSEGKKLEGKKLSGKKTKKPESRTSEKEAKTSDAVLLPEDKKTDGVNHSDSTRSRDSTKGDANSDVKADSEQRKIDSKKSEGKKGNSKGREGKKNVGTQSVTKFEGLKSGGTQTSLTQKDPKQEKTETRKGGAVLKSVRKRTEVRETMRRLEVAAI